MIDPRGEVAGRQGAEPEPITPDEAMSKEVATRQRTGNAYYLINDKWVDWRGEPASNLPNDLPSPKYRTGETVIYGYPSKSVVHAGRINSVLFNDSESDKPFARWCYLIHNSSGHDFQVLEEWIRGAATTEER